MSDVRPGWGEGRGYAGVRELFDGSGREGGRGGGWLLNLGYGYTS